MNNEHESNIRRLEERRQHDVTGPAASVTHAPDPSIPFLRPDESFGDKGRMILSSPGHVLSVVSSICPTANDNGSKFWVTAYDYAIPPATPSNYAAVARITKQGQVDTSFGQNGFAQIKFDENNTSFPLSIHETDKGELIVTGRLRVRKGAASIFTGVIVKLLPTGLPDITFGTQGVVYIPDALNIKGTMNISHNFLAVDPDGKILILAYIMNTQPNGENFTTLARLTKDGQLDTSFQGNGQFRVEKDHQRAYPYALARDIGSERIIAICASIEANGELEPYMVGFKSNGKRDSTFGESAYVDLSKYFISISDCAVSHTNGKLLVTGIQGNSAALMVFTAEGRGELNFNEGHPVYMDFGTYDTNIWWHAHGSPTPAGSIMAFGDGSPAGDSAFYAVVGRYTSDGKPDTSFAGESSIAQPPLGETFSLTKDSFTRLSHESFLITGRFSDSAAIFAFKDQSGDNETPI